MAYDYSKPFFEDPPEWLNEDCTFGSLIGGMLPSDEAYTGKWIAESYKNAADALVDQVVNRKDYDGYELVFPILYLYRHAIELYLKMLLKPDKLNHNLKPLMDGFVEQAQANGWKIQPVVVERIEELARIDLDSSAFRYATNTKGKPSLDIGECWVDLGYIKEFMGILVEGMKKLERTRRP